MTLRDLFSPRPAPGPQPEPTDAPATGAFGHYGSEPLPEDQPDTFDALGPLTDQSQGVTGAGWPDPALLAVPATDADLYPRAPLPKPEPVRRWYGETITFAANDNTPRLVTPSGIDTADIIAVTVNGHADGFLLGPDMNTARVGMLLPINRPVRIESGPVWAVAPTAGGQLAIAVEYLTR